MSETRSSGGAPDEARAQELADDRFVHGLLQHMHRDDDAAEDARVSRVMAALRADDAAGTTGQAPAEGTSARDRHGTPIRTQLAQAAALAVLLFGGVALLTLIPSERSVYAIVDAALSAGREAGDRRYTIKVEGPDGAMRPFGAIDLRGADMVLRMQTPDGRMLVAGRDADGPWSIRRDGGVERLGASAALPRWINTGEATVLVESVDALLADLRDGYVIERTVCPEDSDAVCLAAIRDGAASSQESRPDRVDIQLAPDSSLIDRMLLVWERPPPRERRGGRGRGNDAPSSDGRADGERGIDRGPGGAGDRARPPREDELLRDLEFLLGPPPRRDGGRHPPPPRQVLFVRASLPSLDAAWFTPEHHVRPPESPRRERRRRPRG